MRSTWNRVRGAVGLASIVVASVVAMSALAYGVSTNQDMTGPSSAKTDVSVSLPYSMANKVTRSDLEAHTAILQQPVVITRPVLARVPAPVFYRVRPGDTLSKIAKHEYGRADTWTLIYWANKNSIEYADIILVGQNLRIPAMTSHIPAPPRILAPAPPAPVLVTAAVTVPSTKSIIQSAPVAKSVVPQASPVTYSGSSSMQSCIIRAESGGNPYIWNATGHWGLYQFSYGTWVAHGGSPGSFGNAGIAEQNQIYYNTVAADGYADWAPYDGC